MVSTLLVSLFLLLALIAVPIFGSSFLAWQLGLFLLYGVAAQGVGLAWGAGGFLPLGNALFFGGGAYLSAFALKATEGDLWINLGAMLGIAFLLGGLAFIVGMVLFRGKAGSGPSFSLVALALVLIFSQLANSATGLTGGFNGFSGYQPLGNLDAFGNFYFVIVVLVVVVTLALLLVHRLPIGLLLRAMVANEDRLALLGFAPHRLKAGVFAGSAFITGLAGGLYASHQGIVTPQAIGFLLSAEFVIWAAVGGRMHPLGPLLGAVAIGWLSSELRDSVSWWELAVACIFLVVVLLFKKGSFQIVETAINLARRAGLVPQTARHAAILTPPNSKAAEPISTIRFRDIHLQAGAVRILNGVTIELVDRGVLAVIGPNGAGKSTLLNALTGTLPVTGGDVFSGEIQLTNRRPHEVLSYGIGRKMQIPSIFPGLSVAENLRVASFAGRFKPWDFFMPQAMRWQSPMVRRVLAEAGVAFDTGTNDDAQILSQGTKQVLEFLIATAAEPRVLLLDEPAAGMSPTESQEMVRLVRAYIELTGASIVLVEHDMKVVEALSERVAVLHFGEVLAEGKFDEVRTNPKVQDVYAGGHK